MVTQNNINDLPDFSDIVQGSLSMRVATDENDILLSQRLRYKVFFEELHAESSEQTRAQKRDIDPFDDVSDHLLVFDSALADDEYGQLVGSYRLMRQEKLDDGQKFYTESEYDISRIKETFDNILELGRSCVRSEYRTKQVISLLWRGLSRYIMHYDIDVLVGCGSFHEANPQKHEAAIALLHHHHLAPTNIRSYSLSDYDVLPFDETNHSSRHVLRDIPPLIKGYIRVGAYIGEGIYVDHKFDTVDVCMIMPIHEISPRYFNHFFSRDESE
ncbi:MAG: GNAT family N-acetyltransferase [Alphaproteobacteria bacterium]|nr:GNAT family N-acetyltransferase [Alphaproteobacteria bacterium]